jgi:hypothetical protein
MVASAPGKLVYHIPECKPFLVTRRSKMREELLRIHGKATGALKPKAPGVAAGRDTR